MLTFKHHNCLICSENTGCCAPRSLCGFLFVEFDRDRHSNLLKEFEEKASLIFILFDGYGTAIVIDSRPILHTCIDQWKDVCKTKWYLFCVVLGLENIIHVIFSLSPFS